MSIVLHDNESKLIGTSAYMQSLRALCGAVASWPGATVIEGATGTGKGIVAEEIFRHLPRTTPRNRLSAAAEHQLLYTQLFGHRKGAFTGAHTDAPGLVEQLAGGVLFLDDFQDASPELQRYLLDIVEGKEFFAVGARRAMSVQLRLIVGTQTPLAELLAAEPRRLREDLFERLDGVTVPLRPLAAHAEDIADLCAHLLAKLGALLPQAVPEPDADVLHALRRYHWPRNVRELERVLEKAVFAALHDPNDGRTIGVRHLPARIQAHARTTRRSGRPRSVPDELIGQVFGSTGSLSAAANHLGTSERTIKRGLNRLGIEVRRPSLVG